jgi:hypothetical protein
LVVSNDNEKQLADIGTDIDEKGKNFLRAPDKPEKSGLSYGADLLGSGTARPEDFAHIEIDKRCQVCNQDSNSRHFVSKAMKIACLKYRSGMVTHFGKNYERMKLIKIQEDLVDQHVMQLKAIKVAKLAMEKSRDIANDGNIPRFSTKLQDFGI